MTLRVAFPLIGGGNWTGGLNYLKNTLQIIRSRLADEIEAHVFLSPAEHAAHGAELSALVGGRIIMDGAIATAGRGKSLIEAVATGKDAALERLLLARGIDAVFEVASFYGARFAIPAIAWMPDLQHRHMPQMFSRANWWRRDLGFKMQIAAGRTLMLSSATALADMERFYPQSRARGHVVRFAIDLDIAPYLASGAEICAKYNLPERYFFLPNQFWRHKNHAIVVDALARLAAEAKYAELPPVILTGQPKDPRHPAHFVEVMARAEAAGVEDHFRYLGLVPYPDVLALNANCHVMINPSRFEGWSTPIEEAKAFATPLALSDIAIHREQAPGADFFDPASAEAAAKALLVAGRRSSALRPPASILIADQNARLDEHARSLLETIKAATGRKATYKK